MTIACRGQRTELFLQTFSSKLEMLITTGQPAASRGVGQTGPVPMLGLLSNTRMPVQNFRSMTTPDDLWARAGGAPVGVGGGDGSGHTQTG